MSKKTKQPQQPVPAPTSRGEAAYRAQREEIAARNERACRDARSKRQERYEALLASRRADEVRERAELAKLRP